MEVEVLEATVNRVKVAAPLRPNINHRETVFGGSASAVAILSAWSLLHLRLLNEDLGSYRIVIQKNSMSYERPIPDTFMASSFIPDPSIWSTFVTTLQRRNRARIKIGSILDCRGMRVGVFEGAFVALN